MEPDIFHTKPQYSKTDAFKHFCKLLPQSFSFYGAAAFGAYPLDMSQYKNLFNSTRIPNIGQDELKLSIGSKHIVVQRGSKFYKFDVLRDDGKNVPDEEILANIDAILKEPLVVGTDKNPGVGILTTMNRDNWAKARGNITKCSALNIATLEAIDSAIFVVCLEHTSPETRSDVSRTFLVGDGSNHWFDKSFQLIVAKNGMASVNFEHAWGDGVAVLRYLNEMYGDSVKYPVLKSSSPANPKELKWEFDAQTSQTLKDAKKDFDTVTSRLLIESADIPVTRKQIATHNIGVDGVMQMAIQLAHFKLHQKFVSTYESASTAAFKHGRTETVRSCTNEAVSFVKTMIDPAASDAEKEKALRTAVKKHGELTKNGVMGQGFDRHMFALKAIAGIEKFDIPDIFTIPSAQIMSKIILSTSTLSSPCLEGGSFGPVNDECYGIGYGIEGEGSVFQLSSYKSDLAQLRELLYESMLEMESLLSRSASK
jgi:carnitine O-palmitoyltransferase 2